MTTTRMCRRALSVARLLAPARHSRACSSSAHESAPISGVHGVRACMRAMLDQQHALLHVIDDAQYTFHSELLQGSVGQHTRHALDHLRKPLEAWLSLSGAEVTIRYDLRARETDVERDRTAAGNQIDAIRRNLELIDDEALASRVGAAFMLSGDGHEFVFDSTLSRELAFAVHHCIHHSALVKVLLRRHFPHVGLPPDYGMAPSTINYNAKHPDE